MKKSNMRDDCTVDELIRSIEIDTIIFPQFEKWFSEYWDNKYSLIDTKINKYNNYGFHVKVLGRDYYVGDKIGMKEYYDQNCIDMRTWDEYIIDTFKIDETYYIHVE